MHEKEKEKDYEKRYIVYNRHRYTEGISLKNACKIGTTFTKKSYVVHLSMVDGKEVMVVHTFIQKEDDVIERLEGDVARKMFMKLSFY